MEDTNKKQTIGEVHQHLASKREYHDFQTKEEVFRYMSDPERIANKAWNLVREYKKTYPKRDGFIQMIIIADPLLSETPRIHWFGRTTCPEPFYDETVFHYKHAGDELEWLWTVPDPDTCSELYYNPWDAGPNEQTLLQAVKKYKNGELLRRSQELNGITDKTLSVNNPDLYTVRRIKGDEHA